MNGRHVDSVERPADVRLSGLLAVFEPAAYPRKAIMSTADLDEVRRETPPPAGPFDRPRGLGLIFGLPITIDDAVGAPRIEPLTRRPKRADLDTRTILTCIKVNGGWAWEALRHNWPPNLIMAALDREDLRGHIESGVCIERSWLTGKGENWLRDNREGNA